MGPQAAESYPGRRLVRPAGPEAERARQEIDYGRRGVTGHVFGAFQPATGEAFTATYERRTTVSWVDFLGQIARPGSIPRSSASTPCSTTSTSTARPTCC